MIRRFKRTRRYQAPGVTIVNMALERSFCDSLRFNAQVDELHNINKDVEDNLSSEPMYFEF